MTELADRLEETATDVEQAVTPLELFFDLVFVFAITQVTGFVSATRRGRGCVEGMAILTALWWAWESYVWLGNTAGSDEGTVRVVLLSAMGAMLIASLAVPHAFGDDGVIFGVAYLAVRVLHLGAYAIVSRDDPQLRYVVVRHGDHDAAGLDAARRGRRAGRHRAGRSCGRRRWRSTTAASSRAAPRAGASWPATSPSATAWSSSSRWASRSSRSASAREGLGLDAGHHRRRAAGGGRRRRAVVGVLRLRRARRRARPARRPARRAGAHRARLLHLPAPADGGRDRPLRARGRRRRWRHVGDELEAVPAVALCGGVALYLVALSALKRRNIGSFNCPRLVAAAAAGRCWRRWRRRCRRCWRWHSWRSWRSG